MAVVRVCGRRRRRRQLAACLSWWRYFFFFTACLCWWRSHFPEQAKKKRPRLVTLYRTFTGALIFEDVAKFLGGWTAAFSARTPKVGVPADSNIDALHLPFLDMPNLRKGCTKRAPSDCPEDRTVPSALPRASLRNANDSRPLLD